MVGKAKEYTFIPYFIGAARWGLSVQYKRYWQAKVFCHSTVDWIVDDLSSIYDNLYSKEGIPLKLNSTQILYVHCH
jgi:hypothetical protein